MSTLNIYDSETHNPLTAQVRNIDYFYQAEQWVHDLAKRKHPEGTPWLVRWELMEGDTVLAIWTRPEGDPPPPSLTYKRTP